MIHIYEKDSLNLRVPVYKFPASYENELQDITGASASASAQKLGGGVIAADDVTVLDEVNGLVGVSFAAGALTYGTYKLQVRLTIGLDQQTILSELVEVFRNNDEPA